MKPPGKWVVRKTGEELPDYQYRVIRTMPDGTVQLYQYADTRAEADALALEANTMQMGPSAVNVAKPTEDT